MSEKRAPLVSIDDLAITLGVSVSTVRSWVRDGEIPLQTYIRVGKTYRFEQEEVIGALKGRSCSAKEVPSESLTDYPEADRSKMDSAARRRKTMDFIGEHYGRPIKKDDEENEGLAVDSKKTDDAYPKNLDAVDSEITGSQQTIKELIKLAKIVGLLLTMSLMQGCRLRNIHLKKSMRYCQRSTKWAYRLWILNMKKTQRR